MNPGEKYIAAYTAARDRYRQTMKEAGDAFIRAMDRAQAAYEMARGPNASPKERAEGLQHYQAAEHVAKTVYDVVYRQSYETFREEVKQAARMAWGDKP